jgi:hypothetical protein
MAATSVFDVIQFYQPLLPIASPAFHSIDHAPVIGIALHPTRMEHPYLVENSDVIWQIDSRTGESRPFATAAGPRQLLFAGPQQDLFVLEQSSLARFNRDGRFQGRVPLAYPLDAVAYDGSADRLIGLSSALGELQLYDRSLQLSQRLALPQALVDPQDPRPLGMAVSPSDGSAWLYRVGGAQVSRVEISEFGSIQVHTLDLGPTVSIDTLTVTDIGRLLVSSAGVLKEFDDQGQPVAGARFDGLPGGAVLDVLHSFSGPDIQPGPGFNRIPWGGIEGTAFDDVNVNGQLDPDEPGRAGLTITLHRADDNRVVATAVTDALGRYHFDVQRDVAHYLRPENTPGWQPTTPDSIVPSLQGGQILSGINFGSYQPTTEPVDFGDAPASYGTLLVDNGARHVAHGPHMGPSHLLDAEADGQPSADALADDADGSDDEDGVTFPEPLITDSDMDMLGHAEIWIGQLFTSGPDIGLEAYIDAWIDFDQSGTYESDERLSNGSIRVVQTEFFHILFTIPAGTPAGSTYARFRITQHGGLGPTGPAQSGEVEDYQITIRAKPYAAFHASLRTFAVFGTGAADSLELGVNSLGQVELFSIVEHHHDDAPVQDPAAPAIQSSHSDGQRIAVPVFDAVTGKRLDPLGQGWPTVTSTRQVHALLGDGDDVFFAEGALLKRLTVDGELGRDTVILRGTVQRDLLDVANAEVIDLRSGGGNDRVKLRYHQALVADLDWNVNTGAGHDRVDMAIPPPDPDLPQDARLVQISVHGGGGNDNINAVLGVEPTPFLPSLLTEIDIEGGTGNDTVSVRGSVGAGAASGAPSGSSPPFDLPVISMGFNVDGGTGKDRLTVEAIVDDLLPLEIEVNLEGGAGGDVLTARAFLSDSIPAPMAKLVPITVGLHVDGGASRDRLTALASVSDSMAAEVVIDADGGAGRDRISATTFVVHDPLTMFGGMLPVRMDVNLDGGAGGDMLAVNGFVDPAMLVGFNPQPEPPILRVNADGGAGRDAFDAVFSLTAAPAEPLTKSAELEASLLGGLGDDAFRLLWDEAAWDVLAFVDGGLGSDSGVLAPGAEHESVEAAG